MDSVMSGFATTAASVSWDGAQLARYPVKPGLTLRARGDGVTRLAVALGLEALPHVNGMVTTSTGALLAGLGPEEWVVLGVAPAIEVLAAAVGADGAVVDTGASRVGFSLNGRDAREVLSSCCALDLAPQQFTLAHCAQTLIGHVGVFLARIGEDRFLIATRPSTADYVVRWLIDGMAGVRADRESTEA